MFTWVGPPAPSSTKAALQLRSRAYTPAGHHISSPLLPHTTHFIAFCPANWLVIHKNRNTKALSGTRLVSLNVLWLISPREWQPTARSGILVSLHELKDPRSRQERTFCRGSCNYAAAAAFVWIWAQVALSNYQNSYGRFFFILEQGVPSWGPARNSASQGSWTLLLGLSQKPEHKKNNTFSSAFERGFCFLLWLYMFFFLS